MTTLITRADIALYKQISKTPHDDKINEAIREAQLIDIKPLLGERLFYKILAAPADYEALLTGGEYTYNGETYHSNGLKMVLCYYAYARYIYFGSAIDTPFSVVEKLNDNSRPVDPAYKKTVFTDSRATAASLWGSVHDYLIRTVNPDYHRCSTSAPARSFRMTKIQ